MYQLQRRLRTLKEQMEKKDLHLDMLRRKITLLEDSIKLRRTLELERDEACSRSKKQIKQIERLEMDLKEARLSLKDLKSQLTDATEYKVEIPALFIFQTQFSFIFLSRSFLLRELEKSKNWRIRSMTSSSFESNTIEK